MIARERAQASLAPDAPATDAMSIVQQRVQRLDGDCRRVVFLPLGFLDDDFEFVRQLAGVDQGTTVRVRLDFKRGVEAAGWHHGVVQRVVVDRRRVQVSADGLGLPRDLAHAARGRALEVHVLQHMRDADLVVRFVEIAGVDVGDDRGDRDRRVTTHQHAQPVGKRAALDSCEGGQGARLVGADGAGCAAHALHVPGPARSSQRLPSSTRPSLSSVQPRKPCADWSSGAASMTRT